MSNKLYDPKFQTLFLRKGREKPSEQNKFRMKYFNFSLIVWKICIVSRLDLMQTLQK